MRRALSALFAMLMGCDPGFRPESLVENLRLIGIRAEPASLRPGEAAQLTALLVDPSRTQPATVLWLGCEADAFNLNRSPCANLALLEDPSSLTGADAGVLPPGVSVIGIGERALYRTSPELFSALPPDDGRRQQGTVGQAIAYAVAETVSPQATAEELQALLERVRRKEVRSVLALFRIPISESTVRNRNPEVEDLVVGGERWPKGAAVLVREGEPVSLDILAPESSFEPYFQQTPTANEMKNERILAAWYSTSGRFSEQRTALGEGVKTVFTAPGKSQADPLPERRTGTVYTVFRDTRGGQSWRQWPFFVCDVSLGAPTVSSVDWPAQPDAPVVVHGANMSSVLDVVVDEMALERTTYSPTSGTFQGFLPAQVPVGIARGVLHTRACTRLKLRD